MWEGAARWSTQLRRGCWVATGLSQWMGCSDPQGSGRGRESINPVKMKLCPGCHNPFASSKLYKLFAVFFAFGWWMVWIQSVEVLLSSFFVRQKWYVGILGKKCCSCKTKENQQQRENQLTKIHKQTTKQENQIINTQTNKTIKTLVGRHNLVVLTMGVCTIRLKVWNKDGYGRREYVQREMYNLKLKWTIGKMTWYTVDIKNSMFQHHTICHHR